MVARPRYRDVEILRATVLQRFPLVFLDNCVEELPASVVTTDNEEASGELVRRCLQLGAVEFALLFQDVRNPVQAVRLQGAETELKSYGVPYFHAAPAGTCPPLTPAARPLAILGTEQQRIHQFAAGCASQLGQRRLMFGCFDEWVGEPGQAEAIVVRQDSESVARLAMERLLSLMEYGQVVGPRITRVPVRGYQIVRSSF